jgi:hypothetical protein
VYTRKATARDKQTAEYPGPHQVSVAVITRDGSGYYQPTPPRTFTTSQFFPEWN